MIISGTYIGARSDRLFGERALLISNNRSFLDDDTRGDEIILAQFNNRNLPEAYCWHPFRFDEFAEVRRVND